MHMKQFRATNNRRKTSESIILEQYVCLSIIFEAQINEEDRERSPLYVSHRSINHIHEAF